MQSGIPNNVEEGAQSARNLISGSNANGNTVNQGSQLTPANTASTAEQAAPKGVENTRTVPAPDATPNGGYNTSVVDHSPSQSEIVLAGKYRKEVPELNRTIKMHESTIEILQSKNAGLKKDIEDLEKRLATASQHGVKSQDAVPNDPKSLMDALNPDDFQIYGDEFVNLAKIMKDSVAQMQTHTKAQAQPQGRTPEQKAYDNILFAAIGENTFHDINSDPRFVYGFLNQVNPETSRYYRSDLLESHEDLDSATVIKIFKAFIDSLGGQYTKNAPAQQNTNQNPNVPQNYAQPPGNIKNASFAPNFAASNTNLTPSQMDTNAETFTQQQVDAFYKSITPGVGEYAGPQYADWARDMKTRILAAYNSGRVFKNIQ